MSDGPPLLSNAVVMRRAGITYRQLDHWAVRGYLVPAGGTRTGSGFARTWTPAELAVACPMGRLTGAGLPPEMAARVARSGQARYEMAPGIVIEVSEVAG
jgi:hypothetical protein